jgi:hypothetical protein
MHRKAVSIEKHHINFATSWVFSVEVNSLDTTVAEEVDNVAEHRDIYQQCSC